jgi:hypothetical protein
LPATVALHETVAVPDPVMLPGKIEPHTRPEGTVSLRVTVAANLLTAAIVMVEVLDVLTLTVIELAAIVKSRN